MHILTVSIIAFCWIALKISLESFLLKLSCLMFSCKFFSTVLSASIAIGANENLLLKYVSWRIGIKGWRCNFSLVACYSLKCTRCSLFVVTSLVTRCKKSFVTRCKNSLVTRCKIHLMQKTTCYLLWNLLVTRCNKPLVTQYIIHHSSLLKTITGP